jgi:hypothetical protein
MTDGWTRLLDFAEQPKTLRHAYELLEEFAAALKRPSPIDVRSIAFADTFRLGYLLAAFRLFADAPMHASWTEVYMWFERHPDRSKLPKDAVLLMADERANPLDGLAISWGLRKGLDPRKVNEIVKYGAT